MYFSNGRKPLPELSTSVILTAVSHTRTTIRTETLSDGETRLHHPRRKLRELQQLHLDRPPRELRGMRQHVQHPALLRHSSRSCGRGLWPYCDFQSLRGSLFGSRSSFSCLIRDVLFRYRHSCHGDYKSGRDLDSCRCSRHFYRPYGGRFWHRPALPVVERHVQCDSVCCSHRPGGVCWRRCQAWKPRRGHRARSHCDLAMPATISIYDLDCTSRYDGDSIGTLPRVWLDRIPDPSAFATPGYDASLALTLALSHCFHRPSNRHNVVSTKSTLLGSATSRTNGIHSIHSSDVKLRL
jgi:hypothetical protein